MTHAEIARRLADHVRANGMPSRGTTLFDLFATAGVAVDGQMSETFSADLHEIAQDCLSIHVAGNEPLDDLNEDAFLDLMRAMAGDEPEPAADTRPLAQRMLGMLAERMIGMPVEDALAEITRGMTPARLQEIIDALPSPREGARESTLPEPITITGFSTRGTKAWNPSMLFGGRCGDMVAIRPVAREHGDRTFLGILLGEIAQGVSLARRKSDGALIYDMGWHNPAVFVPDLDTMIFGNASWWSLISSPDQLREITDADIESVWYVKALRQIDRFRAEDEADEAADRARPE